MSSAYKITASAVVREGVALKDGRIVLESGKDVSSFTKELYKCLKTDYPKFYKMDSLCKLAFVAAELLLHDKDLAGCSKDEIGLVFSNASASLDTDKTYYRSVEDKANYFPSPAVFVYTLPNIMMGELCIRHKISGENIFFISKEFDGRLLADYSLQLLTTGKAGCVIAGWVEINEKSCEAVLGLIEKSEAEHPGLSPQNLKAIYSSG